MVGKIAIGSVDSAGNHVRIVTLSRLRHREARFDAQMGEAVTLLDTDNPQDPALSEVARKELARLRDFRFEATIDPQGRIQSYRAFPEEGILAQEFSASAMKLIQQDHAELSRNGLRIGDTWSLGRRSQALGETGLGSVSFELTGTLLRVETRNGSRHALLRVTASDARQERSEGVSGPGLEVFTLDQLAEYDFDKGRFVKVVARMRYAFFALDLSRNDILHVESTQRSEERDANAAAWMVDEAGLEDSSTR